MRFCESATFGNDQEVFQVARSSFQIVMSLLFQLSRMKSEAHENIFNFKKENVNTSFAGGKLID